jgi:hypothetical protein
MSGITFLATLFKAQTEPAGGWKIILDVPESDAKAILQLAALRDTPLSVGIVPYDEKLNEDIIDFSRDID